MTSRISSPIRARALARRIGVPEDDVLLWLLEHAEGSFGPQGPHAADFLQPDLAERAWKSLSAPMAPPVPTLCQDCLPSLPAGPGAVRVSASADCSRCGGSINAREAAALAEAFAVYGMRRLLVVGGGPGTLEEIRVLLGDAIDVRVVEGEPNRHGDRAEADLRWADVAVIWGSTILPHRVSKLYTDRREFSGKTITVPVRGVAALCRAVADKARRLYAHGGQSK